MIGIKGSQKKFFGDPLIALIIKPLETMSQSKSLIRLEDRALMLERGTLTFNLLVRGSMLVL